MGILPVIYNGDMPYVAMLESGLELKPFMDTTYNGIGIRDGNVVNIGGIIPKGTVIMVSYPMLSTLNNPGKISKFKSLADQILYMYTNPIQFDKTIRFLNDASDTKIKKGKHSDEFKAYMKGIPNIVAVRKKMDKERLEKVVKLFYEYRYSMNGFDTFYGYSYLLNCNDIDEVNTDNINAMTMVYDSNELEYNILRPCITIAVKDIHPNSIIRHAGYIMPNINALENNFGDNGKTMLIEGYLEEFRMIHPLTIIRAKIGYKAIQIQHQRIKNNIHSNMEYLKELVNDCYRSLVETGMQCVVRLPDDNAYWFEYLQFASLFGYTIHWQVALENFWNDNDKERIDYLFSRETGGFAWTPNIMNGINKDFVNSDLIVNLFITYRVYWDEKNEFYDKKWRTYINNKKYYEFLMDLAKINFQKYLENTPDNGIITRITKSIKNLCGNGRHRDIIDCNKEKQSWISLLLTINCVSSAIMISEDNNNIKDAYKLFADAMWNAMKIPRDRYDFIQRWFKEDNTLQRKLSKKILTNNLNEGIKYYYASVAIYELKWMEILSHLFKDVNKLANNPTESDEMRALLAFGHIYFKRSDYEFTLIYYNLMKEKLRANKKMIRVIKQDHPTWINEYGYCAIINNALDDILELSNIIGKDETAATFNTEGYRTYGDGNYKDSVYYFTLGIAVIIESADIMVDFNSTYGNNFGDIGQLYYDYANAAKSLQMFELAIYHNTTYQNVYSLYLQLIIDFDMHDMYKKAVIMYDTYIEPKCESFDVDITANIHELIAKIKQQL